MHSAFQEQERVLDHKWHNPFASIVSYNLSFIPTTGTLFLIIISQCFHIISDGDIKANPSKCGHNEVYQQFCALWSNYRSKALCSFQGGATQSLGPSETNQVYFNALINVQSCTFTIIIVRIYYVGVLSQPRVVK